MSSRLHPLARLIIAAIGLFVAQVLAGLILGAIYIGVLLARAPGQPIDKIIAQLSDATETNALILTLFVYPIGLLWLGFCRAKLDKRSFVSLGLRRPRFGSNLARGAVAGFLSIAIIWAILWVTGAISVDGWSDAAKTPTAYLALLGWLVAFAVVGFFEEFVFRGYALHNLTDWLGWRAAVLIQATIFALIHLANVATASNEARLAALGAMPSIFLIGVFFALAYRKTGSLWFPIGFHAAWNFSLGCLFSLPVSGIKTFQLLKVQANADNWLSGGSFGAEGSFFLLPVLLALIWFILQAPDHPQALLDLELNKFAAAPRVDAAPAAPIVAPELEAIEEETRENRYRTKFGTSEGFDASMLSELRDLQRQREVAQAETQRESAAQVAALNVDLLISKTVAEKETAPESTEAAEIAIIEAEKPRAETKNIEAKSVEVQPVEIAPVAEVETVKKEREQTQAEPPLPIPAKKKSSPKW